MHQYYTYNPESQVYSYNKHQPNLQTHPHSNPSARHRHIAQNNQVFPWERVRWTVPQKLIQQWVLGNVKDTGTVFESSKENCFSGPSLLLKQEVLGFQTLKEIYKCWNSLSMQILFQLFNFYIFTIIRVSKASNLHVTSKSFSKLKAYVSASYIFKQADLGVHKVATKTCFIRNLFQIFWCFMLI